LKIVACDFTPKICFLSPKMDIGFGHEHGPAAPKRVVKIKRVRR
jgi:hypothetical protein